MERIHDRAAEGALGRLGRRAGAPKPSKQVSNAAVRALAGRLKRPI